MIVLRHENTFEALPQRTIMFWMLLPFRESVIAMLLLDDDLWMLITPPLLSPRPPRRLKHPGRKTIDDRLALMGLRFLLKSGIPWEMLSAQFGCCGTTG